MEIPQKNRQRDKWVKIGRFTEIKNPRKDPETGEILIEGMRTKDKDGNVRVQTGMLKGKF